MGASGASAGVGEPGRAVNPVTLSECVRIAPRPLTFVAANESRGRERALLELALEERDGRGCFYCASVPLLARHHIDHVTPRSRGGSDGIANLVHACKRCNLRKSTLPGWFYMLETHVARLADRPRNFLLDFGKSRLAVWGVAGRFGLQPPFPDKPLHERRGSIHSKVAA